MDVPEFQIQEADAMTTKELRKLRRAELLQLLLDQVQENEQLKSRVNAMTTQLNKQRIACENAGSIAEAALALSNIFQDADQVARKYLQEVEELTARQEQELREKADQAREQADKLVADAMVAAAAVREEADACLAEAKEKAETLLENARAEADAYWDKVNSQVQTLLEGQDMLKSIVYSAGKNKTL